MKTEHTPGPWWYSAGDVMNPDRAFGIIAYDPEPGEAPPINPDPEDEVPTQCVAEICDGDTAEADARLVAASPELLKACKAILRAPSVGSNAPGSVDIRVQSFVFDALRDAIRMAEEGPSGDPRTHKETPR